MRCINSWLEFYQIFIKRFYTQYAPENTLQDLYHCLQEKGESINTYLQRPRAMIALIHDETDEIEAHHFKTQLYIDQGELFELLDTGIVGLW